MSWGFHLVVDCKACNENVSSFDAINTFVKKLVKAIDMKAFGEPQMVRFGNEPNLTGITLVQLIETSNICAHFCDESGDAYIDIFSCKDFKADDALQVIQDEFTPEHMNVAFLERDASDISGSRTPISGPANSL